jgi:hypothetical protein
VKQFLFAQKVWQYVEYLLANCMRHCDSCFIHKLGMTRAQLSLHQLIPEDVFVSSIFWTLKYCSCWILSFFDTNGPIHFVVGNFVGIPGGVLPSPALQQTSQLLESPPHTDPGSNGTAFDIPDHLLMEDGLTSDETPFGDFHSWMATCTLSFA